MQANNDTTGRALVIHPSDNVATAIRTGPAVTRYRVQDKSGRGGTDIHTAAPVEFGHKIALIPIPAGREIIKYGETIGRATTDIDTGSHVHIHNMESCRGKGK
ncbi:MAG: UxaA family hydrolase [Desulfobacterales bacterium]|nr:UxaA family hydrolase [Desulfobacterales bacterium]